MPRIKITQLPKYKFGDPTCPEGQMYDEEQGKCVDVPNISFRGPTDLSDPGMKFQQPKEDIKAIKAENKQERNRQNWLNDPRNQMTTTGFGQDFYEGTGITPPQYNASKKYNKKGQEVKPFNIPTQQFPSLGQMALPLGNIWATNKANTERKEAYDKQFRFAQFNPAAQPGMYKGNWTADSQKTFQPNMQAPVNEGMLNSQFGGVTEQQPSGKVKIKIIDGPEPYSMEYGGQFKGSYGFDVGWRNLYTDMAKTSSDHITNTMSEKKNPDEEYVLEAEGGEVVYKPGDHTSHTISGPDHSQGGVKLTGSQVNSKTVPDVSSFIFSKTKGMAIKDPEILARFGITNAKKSGVVPAEIAKKFELNKYKAIIEDPNKDDLAKRTAALMLDRNEKYLAELSVIHEDMKGKEAPEFAKTILGGEKAEAKYGGWFSKQGNLRKFVGGGPNDIKPYGGDEYGKYRRSGPKSNASKYSKQQWEEKLKELGYTGKLNNKSVQRFLYSIPEIKVLIDEAHSSRGYGPNKARKIDDGILGARFDDFLDEAVKIKPTTITTTPPDTTLTTTQPPDITIPITTTTTIVGGGGGGEKNKFICIVDPNTGTKIVPSETGYDSEAEARANCGKTAKLPPFDFTTPDKMALAAAAAVFPRKDYPTIANRPYERGRYALNDWAAAADRAFNTQFLAPSRALAAYTSPQGLMSNMSAASGQAADTIVGNIIPTITGQNVGTFNQYSAQEAQRKDAIDDYNAKAQVARDQGRAKTEQDYQQELANYLTNYAEQYGKSWVNRYKWNDAGFQNPNFYKDPRTGRTIFRNTGGFSGVSNDGNDVGSMGSSFNTYYKKFYDDMSNISDPVKRDAEARRMAARAVGAGRVSRSGKDPYDIYGSRTRSTSYNLPDDEED